MSFIFGIILALLGSVFANFQGAQSKGQDTVSKNDINSIYQKLEEHYNENGEYPTIEELKEEYTEVFPGIDKEALYDNNDKFINDGSDYTYEPTDCTATGCQTYSLSASLSTGDTYTKSALNGQ